MLGSISDNKYNIYERGWSKFDQEKFVLEYFSVDWKDLLKIDELNATYEPLKKLINRSQNLSLNLG